MAGGRGAASPGWWCMAAGAALAAADGSSPPAAWGVGAGSGRRAVGRGGFPPRPAQWEAPGIPRHPLFTNQPQRAELQL